MAKILANDLIEVFLEDQLHNLDRDENKSIKIPHSTLNWTGSKTALIELIYALYADESINNSYADIKLIASAFEKMLKNITPEFFDLKTKLAGDIFQKFTQYRMALIIIVSIIRKECVQIVMVWAS